VVGSGFMGSGIAGTAVLNVEVDTRLKDADLFRVGKGIRAATDILDERLKRRRLTRPHVALSSRLFPLCNSKPDTCDVSHLRHRDTAHPPRPT
jgi:3-hydroxyacyl-CoA dehydrogenase